MDSLPKGKSLWFDDRYLVVELEDRRLISTPLDWYPELQQLDPQARDKWEFICRGTGIEWPEHDYQLSIESMLAGVPLRVRRAAVPQ